MTTRLRVPPVGDVATTALNEVLSFVYLSHNLSLLQRNVHVGVLKPV